MINKKDPYIECDDYIEHNGQVILSGNNGKTTPKTITDKLKNLLKKIIPN